MSSMNRRDFIRTAAVASAAGATACVYDWKAPQENILPYVTQPDNALVGAAAYVSSVCVGCASACGLVARVKEGRVVMVEGNDHHPDGGGLCTRGHFDILATYSPDRLSAPHAAGTPTTWDEAIKTFTAAAAQQAGKQVAWLGKYRTGSLAAILDELTATVGLRRVHWEPLGVETLLAASRAVFGRDALPRFELAGARTIVSFGYDFLGTAHDAMHLTKGYAAAKDPALGGFVARFVAIEPRIGLTSSEADNFLPPRPGTEAQVALALAKLVADAKGYAGPAASLLASVDPAALLRDTDVSLEKLREVAGWVASAPSVVLPGGFQNAGVDATALAIATLLVNEAAGNVGASVIFGQESRLGQVNAYADVKQLVEDARAGKIGVLFIDGLNPVYNLPPIDDVGPALDAVGLVVQLDNEPNDSSRAKVMLLPVGTGLESWGDAEVVAGVHVLQQPAMNPMADVRGVGDLLLALGTALAPNTPASAPVAVDAAAPPEGGDPAAAVAAPAPTRIGFAGTFRDYVRARWERELFPRSGAVDSRTFWEQSLSRGGFFAPATPSGAAVSLSALPAASPGIAGSDLALVVYPHPHLADGRHANRPWAQELPDSIATYAWTTWAELNPKTVERLGLGPKDLVTVHTTSGEITVGYFASPGVREDTVAVSLGNGHDQMGRFGTKRGANAMKLLAAGTDTASGAFAPYTMRASVKRVAGTSDAHALVGHIDQDNRELGNVVSVDEALKHLEGEAGSIVHVHTIPVDERLTSSGIVDMYPEPQHPTYRFAMAIDTNTCNGCMACVIACNLENNIPFVGPDQVRKGRTMSWIRMNRYWEGEGEHQDVRHMPSLCQHCAHAPCEGVCPVLATYHNLDGLNAMIYNRCVGTRYCANNCPYTARRFNYHTWTWPESMYLMLNPDVSVREMGVMEKCTFCVQRTRAVKDAWKDVDFAQRNGDEPVSVTPVPDAALRKLTACASACPTDSITFGNAKDATSEVAKRNASPRTYAMLAELNTKPGVRYMARVRHDWAPEGPHGGGHAASAGGHGSATADAHGEAHPKDHAPAAHPADAHGTNDGHGAPAAGH